MAASGGNSQFVDRARPIVSAAEPTPGTPVRMTEMGRHDLAHERWTHAD
jgi:hypothetical protein